MQYYKFVNWDIKPVEEFLGCKIPYALVEYDKGNVQPMKDLHIATTTPVFKIGGWAFPYAEYMRKFWVKTRYYGIIEVYAMNKTDIRKEYGHEVIKIIEVAD